MYPRNGKMKDHLQSYNYLPELTAKLKRICRRPLNDGLLNQIVLWKVNRYAEIDDDLLQRMNLLAKVKPGMHTKAEDVLLCLLSCKGFNLPMATTILRFLNPDTFQIIDRRAYRAVYPEEYPRCLSTTKKDEKVRKDKVRRYFLYLDKLRTLCRQRGDLEFRTADEALYQYDKDTNRKLRPKKTSGTRQAIPGGRGHTEKEVRAHAK